MEKIGIITFHGALNIGAVLQTYALNKYLKNNGKNVYTVNHLNDAHSIYFYEILRYLKNKTYNKKRYKTLLNFINTINSFKSFLFSNVYLSKLCYDEKNINKLDFDILIFGSDQIWKDIDKNIYFGNKLKAKKISYAASGIFGFLQENEIDIIKQELESYKNISVREKFMVDYLSTILSRKIELVCDPTLLLEKADYETLTNKSKLSINEKFVFIYNINNSIILTKIANNFKQKYGYKIYHLNRYCNLNDERYIGPYEFLYLIKNAEYILTDSFHGTAFSIIFEKQFYTYASEQGKDRYMTLLTKAGLTNRLIDDNFKFSEEKINYKKVKENLTPFIEYSKNYLRDNI